MPQPSRGGSSTTGGGAAKSAPARKTTARKAPAKRATSGAAAGKASAGRTAAKSTRGTAAKATGGAAAKSPRASAAKPARSAAKGARSTASQRGSAAKRSAAGSDVRLDAVANRLRKLNERIIDAGREAGESTLTSYEKALKAIATGIEKGPGRSDIDWIAHLATSQAKFIRELTDSWASAARGVLKP